MKTKRFCALIMICILLSLIMLTGCGKNNNVNGENKSSNLSTEIYTEEETEPTFETYVVEEHRDKERLDGPIEVVGKHTTLITPEDYVVEITRKTSSNDDGFIIHIADNLWSEYKNNRGGAWKIRLTIEEEDSFNNDRYVIGEDSEVYDIKGYTFYKNEVNNKQIFTTYTNDDGETMYAVFDCLRLYNKETEFEGDDCRIPPDALKEDIEKDQTLKLIFSKFDLH